MKQLVMFVLLVALLFVAMPAFAETTGNGDYETRFMNNRLTRHDHSYQDTHADLNVHSEREMDYGAGLDLAIPVTENFSIEAQNKFDLGNMEYSGYLVGKIRFDVFGVDKK